MSDYGFATYDEKSGKRLEGVVNSKWPIFGPSYKQIKRAFRTIHFTDTQQYTFQTSSSVVLPPAQSSAISEYHAHEKVLIATIPHGFKKRPAGYVSISGRFVKNKRCRWEYVRSYDRWNFYPPSMTLNGIVTKSGNMQSFIGGYLRPTTDDGGISAFNDNYYDGYGEGDIAIAYPADAPGWLANNYYSIPGNNSSVEDQNGTERPPYGVEIDDENVYIYRYWYWSDVYKRDYLDGAWDVRAREKAVIDYAGSDFDVTLYLCPYTFDDLLPKQYVAPILNVGIWDNDNWDNGKVYGI